MESRRKVGTTALYAIADDSVFALCEQICGALQSQLAELSTLIGTDRGASQPDRGEHVPVATPTGLGPVGRLGRLASYLPRGAVA